MAEVLCRVRGISFCVYGNINGNMDFETGVQKFCRGLTVSKISTPYHRSFAGGGSIEGVRFVSVTNSIMYGVKD
jgi:hypothetical protein